MPVGSTLPSPQTAVLIYDFSLFTYLLKNCLPSVLWRCWLGGRKGIRPVKNEWWGAGVAIFLQQGADLHMTQLMPLPLTVSCFSKIKIGFTFLVLAHPGSPGQRAVKRVCVCVCVLLKELLQRRQQTARWCTHFALAWKYACCCRAKTVT